MKKITIFVDAGYFFSGSTYSLFQQNLSRKDILFNAFSFVEYLKKYCLDSLNGELLRVYWYDGVLPTGLSNAQQEISLTNHISFRKGFINEKGEQKCVDTRIVADIIEFSYQKSMEEIIVIGSDADLTVGVEKAQNLGVKVHLLTVSDICISQELREQSDTYAQVTEELLAEWISTTVQGDELPQLREEQLTDITTAFIDKLDTKERESLIYQIKYGEGKIPKQSDKELLTIGRLYLHRNLVHEEKHQLRHYLKTYFS